jgi:hypothetical protein
MYSPARAGAFRCGRCAGTHKCREHRMRRSDQSHQNILPRGLRPATQYVAGNRGHHGWRKCKGIVGNNPCLVGAADAARFPPMPRTGPRFGCPCPRRDRRGGKTLKDDRGGDNVKRCTRANLDSIAMGGANHAAIWKGAADRSYYVLSATPTTLMAPYG